MEKKKIKTIIFDLDNTLIDLTLSVKQALELIFRNIGSEFLDNYLSDFLELDDFLWDKARDMSSGISKESVPTYRFEVFFNRHKIAYYDYKQANEWFKEGLATSVFPYRNTEAVIKKIYEKGYTICVATNGLESLQKPRIINTSFSKYIKRIFVSEEVGADKPDPKIFIYLMKEMQIDSEEAIMIGDSKTQDIKGAQAMNIKTIWFNPGRKKNLSNIIPDYEINNMEEVIRIIDSLNDINK